MLMDFKMTAEDWTKVVALFGKARDEYSRQGDQTMASQADEAIALVRHIMTDFDENYGLKLAK
jgi:hypothetical protein